MSCPRWRRSNFRRVAREVGGWPVPVTLVSGTEARRAAFGEAVAAVAVTGTVTLELALASVPMVTVYLGDPGQMRLLLKYRPATYRCRC